MSGYSPRTKDLDQKETYSSITYCARVNDILDNMATIARKLQEPPARFLTPQDYPFLRSEKSEQQQHLYLVK